MPNKKAKELEEKRLKWFRKLCSEAYYDMHFEGLGDMLDWMSHHANKV